MVSIFYKDGGVWITSVDARNTAEVIPKLNLNADLIKKIILYKDDGEIADKFTNS